MTYQKNRYDEPLLKEDNSRFVQFPIRYQSLQDAYEKHEAAFWSSKEIDYNSDINDWNSLSDDERYFIEHILAFFAGSDGIVFENLNLNFCNEVKVAEARNFYGFQAMIENIHAQTYAMLLDTFVKDIDRKECLFNAIDTIPAIGKKANWALKWFDTKNPFEERVVAFSIVEGIFFSGAFCSIFWLKSRNKMTKALGKSNELIARDESLHCDFAVLIYHHLLNKISQERMEEILREAVEIEEEFICDSLPCRLIGMNSDLMRQYIKYVADRLLIQLGFKKIYNLENPFDFMKMMNLDGKTNFFEARTTEYVHSSTAKATEDSWDFGNVEF
jgi:ribonucleotide reductase beta subunit family protein with ferritin-like domain